MNWCLRGFIDYQQIGELNPPASVVDDTNDFIRDANQVLQFVQDRCELAEGARCGSSELYSAYQEWAIASCLRPMSIKAFNPALERTTSLMRKRNSDGFFWPGIKLLPRRIIGF